VYPHPASLPFAHRPARCVAAARQPFTFAYAWIVAFLGCLRARAFGARVFVSLAVLALAACGGGGGGGSGDGSAAPTGSAAQPAATTATVNVTISGLPTGTSASVRIDGAGGYSRMLTASGTLADVPPGTVNVVANRLIVAGTPWDPIVTPTSQSVTAGSAVTISVNYVGDTSPLVTVSGVARYDSVPANAANGALDYAATRQRPIRGAVVEAVSSPGNEVLLTTSTDGEGRYTLQVRQSATNVVVRLRAQYAQVGTPSWNFQVLDNTRGNAPYVLTSSPRPVDGPPVTVDFTATSGWTGVNYGADRLAAPFAILDAVWLAHQKTVAVAPAQTWPPLDLMWSVNNRPEPGTEFHGQIGTTRFVPAGPSSSHRIYILGKEDVDTDEYDAHVIVHEFGHYVQDVVSRDHTPAGTHTTRGREDMRLAFSEGWGNAWAAMVLGDPIYRDSKGAGQQGAGSSTFDVATAPPFEQAGWYREDSVGSILWQLHQHPEVGFGPIWRTMTGPMRTLNAVTSLHMFAAGFRTVATAAQSSVLDAALASQRIAITNHLGANETNDGTVADVLPLYRPIPGFSTPVELCVNNDTDPANSELGRFAYGQISLTGRTRLYSFTVSGGTRASIEVIGPGSVRQRRTQVLAPLIADFQLGEGIHTVAVNDDGLSGGRRCLTLTVR